MEGKIIFKKESEKEKSGAGQGRGAAGGRLVGKERGGR